MSIKHWRIYCETESDWTYGYLHEDTGNPTSCFTDPGHTINSNSCQELDTVSDTQVIIKEESTPTGGHFKAKGYKMTCPVGSSNYDYSYPHPISALSITLPTTSDHTDDQIEVQVGPDTTIGTITADVSASDTVITVSQSVIDNIDKGFYVTLDDGTNTDDLGLVTSIDYNLLTITVQTAATKAFASATPTYVKITVKVIDDFTIGPAQRYELGKDKIGGSYVPTNTIVRVKYTNNGSSTKDFYCVIEMLY